MRIHTDRLTAGDFYIAARTARVDMDLTEHGSRSRERAYNVILRGESRRAPNYGTARGVDRFAGEKAATWDQWGVFLAFLFAADSSRANGEPMFTMYDSTEELFHYRTNWRFEDGWPADAHGDHTFRYDPVLTLTKCTKCSALQRRIL